MIKAPKCFFPNNFMIKAHWGRFNMVGGGLNQ
jgi:hypothetical protein